MQFVLFCLLLGGKFLYVQGWGAEGHGIIARLAQSQLTGSVSSWVQDLIPWHWNGSLSSMASWADSIIHANSNPTGFANWQWSRQLHYINTPDWNCTYQVDRDCVDDVCIDGAVRNYTERLTKELDRTQQQEALYFLIHFVGDMHQPLHIAFRSDYGGNNVEGRFMNVSSRTNLHSLWDSGIMKYRMQSDFQTNLSLYYEHIHQRMLRQSPSHHDEDAQQWITESLNFVCREIYFDDQNHTMNETWDFRLGNNYYRRSIEIIEQRLADGGRRLGALLTRIGQNRVIPSTQTTPSSQTTTSPVVYIVIAASCAVLLLGMVLVIMLCIRCRNRHS